MAKKSDRILTALLCSVCNKQNYTKQRNKTTTPKLEINKYCNKCKSHTLHKWRDKLK